jgi:hypothetical protein
MRDAARVMEAALEWICDQPALIGNYAEQNRARDALVEVRALPASNTETALPQVVALVAKVDLHQRMRQGRGEETCEACLADLAKALRLARGEEASE